MKQITIYNIDYPALVTVRKKYNHQTIARVMADAENITIPLKNINYGTRMFVKVEKFLGAADMKLMRADNSFHLHKTETHKF